MHGGSYTTGSDEFTSWLKLRRLNNDAQYGFVIPFFWWEGSHDPGQGPVQKGGAGKSVIWAKQPSDHNEPLCRATTQGREVSQYSFFPWLNFCYHLLNQHTLWGLMAYYVFFLPCAPLVVGQNMWELAQRDFWVIWAAGTEWHVPLHQLHLCAHLSCFHLQAHHL